MIVDAEKVSREADGPKESDSTKKSASRWKGDRPWVRLGGPCQEAGREPLRSQVLLSVTLHYDNTQEFDVRRDEVLLSMSKTPSDDILESLCKLRIREFAQLKTVLELC